MLNTGGDGLDHGRWLGGRHPGDETGTGAGEELAGIERWLGVAKRCRRIEAAQAIDTAQEYVDFDLESTIALARPIEDVDSLRIEGLTDDEADAFWTAVSE